MGTLSLVRVYIVTDGEYSDYRIVHVFRDEEDAEIYTERLSGSRVEEWEVLEAPVERRAWYTFYWDSGRPDEKRRPDTMRMGNPWEYPPEMRDFDGDPRHVEHNWTGSTGITEGNEIIRSRILVVQGWDHARVLKVYSEQRAQELARREGIA